MRTSGINEKGRKDSESLYERINNIDSTITGQKISLLRIMDMEENNTILNGVDNNIPNAASPAEQNNPITATRTVPASLLSDKKKTFEYDLQNTTPLPFKISRIIDYSSKTGKEFPPQPPINNFVPALGELVYDTGERYGNGLQAKVVTMKGEEGRVLMRCLQPLSRPWGLPAQIPVVPVFTLKASDLVATMKAEASRRGITGISKLKKANLYERILAHKNATSEDLQLITLNHGVEKGEARAGVDFLEGEVVFLWKREGDLGWVVDFEGEVGVVRLDDLTSVERPWGLPGVQKGALINGVQSVGIGEKRKANGEAFYAALQKKVKKTATRKSTRNRRKE